MQPPALPPAQTQAPGSAAAPGQRFDFNKWLAEQQPRFYWKFFLIGLVVLIAAEFTANNSQNPIAIPAIILLYAGLARSPSSSSSGSRAPRRRRSRRS